MSKIKNHYHNEIEISQKYGSLICELAYNAAKDEVFSNGLFTNEADIIIVDALGDTSYDEVFQPVFDRHYDYFRNMFVLHIKEI